MPPGLRNRILNRATSTARLNSSHKLLGEDDYSDDGSLGKELLSSSTSTKRSATDCTETSVGSLDETNSDDCDRMDSFSARKNATIPSVQSSPMPEKQTLGSFLDRDRAMSSTTMTRSIADKRGRASKGRSRRVQSSSNRSVASLPVQSSTLPSSPSKSLRDSSQSQSSRQLQRNHLSTSPGGHHHNRHRHHPQHHHRSRTSGAPPRCPVSAPTGRKQRVALRNLPRAPTLNDSSSSLGSHSHVSAADSLYQNHNRKAKSTRDLLKEYNSILDEFGDSTRGPRSATVDLLEEYDQILTEYDDSARADRNTPYTTGWR